MAAREALGEPLTGHTAQLWDVAFRNDQQLLSSAANGSVLVWNLATREPLGPPLLKGVEMETMALSPDGSMVAIGSLDDSGTVTLWQLESEPWPERACAPANRELTPEERQQFGLPES